MKIRGIMMTDWFQIPDLPKWREEDAGVFLSRGINTIYSVADLAVGQPNNRQYLEFARTTAGVKPLLIENIKRIRGWGFDVMLAMDNEPSVRKGGGPFMAGVGGDVKTADLYTEKRLENTKRCYTDLFSAVDPEEVSSIVLYLEPMERAAISWQKSLATWLRAVGYRGVLYTNGIGSAAWGGDSALGVRSMTDKDVKILNADGADMNAGNADKVIPDWITRGEKYPDGWLLYYATYIGKGADKTKPAPLEDWMWKNINIADNPPEQPIKNARRTTYAVSGKVTKATGPAGRILQGSPFTADLEVVAEQSVWDSLKGQAIITARVTSIEMSPALAWAKKYVNTLSVNSAKVILAGGNPVAINGSDVRASYTVSVDVSEDRDTLSGTSYTLLKSLVVARAVRSVQTSFSANQTSTEVIDTPYSVGPAPAV